ncbi:MAG: energy transducer TonB [Gemmatimonadales bacterium]
MRALPQLCSLLLGAALGCGDSQPPDGGGGSGGGGAGAAVYTPPDAEPPVAVNADSPVQYPPTLFEQKIEGDVVLRLFVDSTGRLLPDSTRVAESSGYPALDSAALAGASGFRFAPARRRGLPVATWFLQAVEFRHPQGAALKGGGP